MEFTKDELAVILLALNVLDDKVYLGPTFLEVLNSARNKIANLK